MRKRARSSIAALLRGWQAAPRMRSHLAMLTGGAATAIGAGLVYLPAGLLLGGVEFALYGGFLIDVDIHRGR